VYLAVAPLFLDKQHRIYWDNVFVTIVFGVILMGALYVFLEIIGIPSKFGVLFVLILASALNLAKYRALLVPAVIKENYYRVVLLGVVFVLFGGGVLVGSVMMGFGDYPSVFFNIDTPLRLTHAHEIFKLSEYPPEALTTRGIYRPYHYGSVAAVAVLSDVTGLPLHKAMFWVVLPLLLVGSFCGIVLLCRTVIVNWNSRILAILIVLPFVHYGYEAYSIFVLGIQEHSWLEFLRSAGNEFRWMYEFEPERFSKGLWDVSAVGGMYLLLISAVISVTGHGWRIVVLGALLVFAAFFVKAAVVPAVSVFVAAGVLSRWSEIGTKRLILLCMASFCCVLFLLEMFGASTAVSASVTLNSLDEILGSLEWNQNNENSLVEVAFVSLLVGSFMVYSKLSDCENDRSTKHFTLCFASLVAVWVCFLLVTVFDIQDGSQIFRRTWIGGQVVLIAILAKVKEHSWIRNTIFAVIMFPIIFIAASGHWHKFQHLVNLITTPRFGHEYSENSLLADALSKIPVEGTVIATNDLKYLWLENHHPRISALFGHQAYALDSSWLSQDPELKNVAIGRIEQQKEAVQLFDSYFQKSLQSFLDLAKSSGWTHYLFLKENFDWRVTSAKTYYGDTKPLSITTDKREEILSMGAESGGIFASLSRIQNNAADKVHCQKDGPGSDSVTDLVFAVDIIANEKLVNANTMISLLHLDRKNPGGDFLTDRKNSELNKHNLINKYGAYLGVAKNPYDQLLNQKRFQVLRLPLEAKQHRIWLFTCDDGQDRPTSEYTLYITLVRPIVINLTKETGEHPLTKIYENKKYIVMKFES
jgi:hypothetical protein